MYYEIYFEPSVGKWRIRLATVYFFFFPSAQDVKEVGPDGVVKFVEFDTFSDMDLYTQTIGLHEAYPRLERGKSYASSIHTHRPLHA